MNLFIVGFVAGVAVTLGVSVFAVILMVVLSSQQHPDEREKTRERLEDIGYL